MYTEYFTLTEKPFSIAPDPRYIYMSERHREALAHLVYGIKSEGGFVLLTGEVGTGKTTICRCLLEQLPEQAKVAFVMNPKVTVEELLATVCDEFGISPPDGAGGTKPYIDRINGYLLDAHSRGRNPVLIIDEAQNLSADVLEQVRLLTNLETNRKKLLQIIMLGQPELRDKLSLPELRQLDQRITARYHLDHLGKRDTAAYIKHRLSVAGCKKSLFPPTTIRYIYRVSGGIPRLINMICDRSLLGAYAKGLPSANTRIVKQAAREIFGKKNQLVSGQRFRTSFAVGGLGILAVALLTTTFSPDLQSSIHSYWGGKIKDASRHTNTVKPGTPHPTGAGAQDQSAEIIHSSEGAVSAEPSTLSAPPFYPEQTDIGLPVIPEISREKKKQRKQLLPDITTTLQTPGTSATLDWPNDTPTSESYLMAYRTLFNLWGVEYDAQQGKSACLFARDHDLNCLYLKGGIDTLLNLNRPAILQLKDATGRRYYVALVGLDGNIGTFIVGNEKRLIDTAILGRYWSGSYTVLWRTPPGYQGAVRPGFMVPWIDWLEKRLSTAQDRPLEGHKNQLLSGALLQQVKEFQIKSNLVPDGIIGPQTLIHLNSASGERMPMLSPARKEG